MEKAINLYNTFYCSYISYLKLKIIKYPDILTMNRPITLLSNVQCFPKKKETG